MSHAHPNRSYYPALDGLRGLAILLVVFYHNFGFIRYFIFGWLGVDLFFVLSGFLITDILLKTRGQEHYLRNFYLRRILRIFPLYYATLVVLLLIVPALDPRLLNLQYFIDNQVWLWTYLQNWLYIFNPPPSDSLALNHFWSLAVEEQFYLVWPLLIMLIKNPRWLLGVMVLLLLSVIGLRCYLWIARIQGLAYYNLYTFSRIDGICIGSMLALMRIIDRKAINRYFTLIVLSLAAINFLFYFFNRNNQFSYPYLAITGYTTFAVLFGLLVNEGIERNNVIINRIFGNPVLKFFGSISYSLYIFHWPIYLVLHPALEHWAAMHMEGIPQKFFGSMVATVLAVVLAWISFRTFERYFLNLKGRFA
jgi:peptidoglycan/LPS O-acetylase OafA/YrhL